jgi:hypothetical protein
MSLIALWALLAGPGFDQPTTGGLGPDLAPLKAPLDKAAAALERAVRLAEDARAEAVRVINWFAAGAAAVVAALVTAVVLHAVHLHGLAAGKEDRRNP